MSDLTGEVKAGTALVFSSGCYSDYTFGQVYVAACDFNYLEQAKKCFFEKIEKVFKEDSSYLYVDIDIETFESYLVKNGFLVLCQNQEIHIGDYDFFDDYDWKKEFLKQKGIKEDD